MRIFGLLLAGIVWSLANQGASFAGENFPKTTVAEVLAYRANGEVTRGSAVLLGAERLVTNCHVTAAANTLEIVHNGRSWPAEVEAQDRIHDLCILSATGITGAKANLAKNVTVGLKVFAAGFFDGNGLAVTEGRVVALHDYNGAKVIQVSAPFDVGASGGGLFDEDGRLIGVLTFKARKGGTFHFAVPTAWIIDLNRADRENCVTPTLAFWQQPPDKQPVFVRAASLEAAQMWDALAALAEYWTKESPMNSRAWIALETAFRHLQRLDDAMLARGQAQRLDFIKASQRKLPNEDAGQLHPNPFGTKPSNCVR